MWATVGGVPQNKEKKLSQGMTYAKSGVDYDAMDPFKRMAQIAGRETADNIRRLNGGEFREFEPSRGESAFLIEATHSYFAHVEEGLGTKNLVADAMRHLHSDRSYYDQIAQDTVAMIVNDIITVGALPLSVAMHLAVGHSKWFDDEQRCRDLVWGWKNACNIANCVWGGGETPTLKDIINPDAVVLSGSAMGLVKPKGHLINSKNIQSGDQIILLTSSGIHANGLTLARKLATRLPKGYLTQLPNGTLYGEALLEPTLIYVRAVEALQGAGIHINYAVNVTGHGWRKLMRAVQSFTYVIERMPISMPVFEFIQEHGNISDEEMYGNLNMGAGFAFYVPVAELNDALSVLKDLSFCPVHAGYIESAEQSSVVIQPKNIEFKAETMTIR